MQHLSGLPELGSIIDVIQTISLDMLSIDGDLCTLNTGSSCINGNGA